MTYLHYNLHGALNIIVGIFDLVLGLFVLSRNPRSRLHQSFFLVTVSCFMWMIGFGMVSLVSVENGLLWVSFTYVFGVPFIPVSIYSFSVEWTQTKNRYWVVASGYVLAFVFMVPMTFFIPHFCGVVAHSWGHYGLMKTTPLAQTYFKFLLLFFYAFGFLSLYTFFRHWRRGAGTPALKVQSRNMLIGFTIAYGGSLDFFAANGLAIYPAGYIYLSALLSVITYSIFRHKSFDIRLVLKRLSLILVIYGVLLALMLPLILRVVSGPVLLPGLLVGVVLSFGPFIYAYVVRNSYWLRGHMTQGLTHELKSPLGTIQGAADMVIDQLNSSTMDKTRALDYMLMIQKNAERMEAFVKDLLDVAKIQSEQLDILREEADFSALVAKIVEHYQSPAGQKGLHLESRLESGICVEIDRLKIEQVISNILSNAIKFSDSGTIAIELKKTPQGVLVSVADEGRGIETKHLPKIFDRFYQSDRGAKGSGIGLTIAKAWVEAHGGRIWAESDGKEKGTKIIFTL